MAQCGIVLTVVFIGVQLAFTVGGLIALCCPAHACEKKDCKSGGTWPGVGQPFGTFATTCPVAVTFHMYFSNDWWPVAMYFFVSVGALLGLVKDLLLILCRKEPSQMVALCSLINSVVWMISSCTLAWKVATYSETGSNDEQKRQFRCHNAPTTWVVAVAFGFVQVVLAVVETVVGYFKSKQ